MLLVWLSAATATPPPDAAATPTISERALRMAIPPGRESVARRLVADPGFMKPVDDTYVISSIELTGREVRFAVRRAAELPDGAPVAEILLLPVLLAEPGDARSPSFAIRARSLVDAPQPDPQITALLARAVASVQAQDPGDFYIERRELAAEDLKLLPARLPDTSATTLARLQGHFAIWPIPPWVRPLEHLALAALALAAWALALLARLLWRRRRPGLDSVIKLTHLLPVAIQILLFAYWALYFRDVLDMLPLILLQLVFAYAFDVLLALTLRDRYTASFGPIPVVLSANLFVWFPPAASWLGLLVIAIGLASKALIHRGGRHIFNPSAFGVAVVGLACILFPDHAPYVDIAHQLNMPPNMLELIFLLALIPQARLPIVLVSLGALPVIEYGSEIAPFIRPAGFWAPVFLAVVLLATDPATIPKTGLGRLLFGATLGVLMLVISTWLQGQDISDFYGKVLPIPLVNAMNPWFDRAAAAITPQISGLFAPRHNRAHVAVWALFVVAHLYIDDVKPSAFEARRHAEERTPLVMRQPARSPNCEENPMFCEPFTFVREAQAWAAAAGTSPRTTP
ncbi:MAG: RnfABCDGE type electron transport complex subunit D [Myxococcota bacterium]